MRCSLAFLFLLPVFASIAHSQETIGQAREWTSHSGAKLRGTLVGTAEGKIVIRNQQGRNVTVATNQFSGADVRYLKRAVYQHLADQISSQAGPASSEWPDVLFVDPKDSQIRRGDKEGKWHVWLSGHWKIHTDRDLPEPLIRELAELFEGALLSIRQVAPSLATPEDRKLKIHLFSSLEELKSEVGRDSPGRDNDWDSVVCVDEMLGLREENGKFHFDPQAPNRFLKMELFELVMNDIGADEPMPMWLYFGLRRIVSRIPHQGAAVFPSAAFEELRDKAFLDRALQLIPDLPSVTEEQWNESTPEIRKGKSEPIYRQHLREASFVLCSYLRVLAEGGSKRFDEILAAAVQSPPPKEAQLNAIALAQFNVKSEGTTLAAAFQKYLGQQWETLSAKTIRRPRKWVNKAGKSLAAELRGVQGGGRLFLKSSSGKGYFIPVAQLSARDQSYALANLWKSIDYESILSDIEGAAATSKRFWPSTLSFPGGGITKARFNRQETKEGAYVYKTKNFHFTLFGRYPISEAQMEEIARLFEATRELLMKSPIGVQASPIDGYFRAELYDTEAAYHLAGGPKMSGGVYKRSNKKFLVPVERGGTKAAEGGLDSMGKYMMEIKYHKETLVHEITHMMMHDILARLPIFMIEGTAEYVEHMPRRQNAFHQSEMLEGIKDTVKYYKRKQEYYRRRNETVPGPYEFEGLLTMSRKQWFDHIGDSAHRQGSLYFGSFLLVSYFMEEEPERLIAMLEACRKDSPGLKVFEFEQDQYRKAVDQFKKFPGVKVVGDGYSYSSHLPHPDLPVSPQRGGDQSDTAHVKILLNGRSVDQVAQLAYDWLRKNGIHVTPSGPSRAGI